MVKELKKGKAFIILDAFMESVPLNEDALEKRAWRTIRKLIEDAENLKLALESAQKVKRVSKEFVEDYIDDIRNDHLSLEDGIKQMLQEAGVEVEDD